jgi:hypothetical protein
MSDILVKAIRVRVRKSRQLLGLHGTRITFSCIPSPDYFGAGPHRVLNRAASSRRRGSRVDEPSAYHAEGVLYLSPNARFDYLLTLSEEEAVGKAVSDAMRDIEKNNPSVSGVLPKTYERLRDTNKCRTRARDRDSGTASRCGLLVRPGESAI